MSVATRRLCFWRRPGAYALCLAALAPVSHAASAQVIAIKTSPVADGDQFSFFPSANLGMGGVSIALADTLRDPFVNPAAGARIRRAHFFSSPSFYSFSRDAGGGQTLPLGGLVRSGQSFAAFAVVAQHISPGKRDPSFGFNPPGVLEASTPTATPTPREASSGNRYAFLMVGHSLERARLSFAASVLWSGLGAIDGVDRLYAGSDAISQSGHASDVRVGLLKEWRGGESLQALVVRNHFGMDHEVSYSDLGWDPGSRQMVTQTRLEHDADRTRTWGVHLQYMRPLADSGWRLGGILTANRMAHPSLPADEIANVPRDHGRSAAFNLGLGVARSRGGSTVGVDAIYEPIWSHMWADGDGRGSASGTTVDNHFRFSNALLRAGVGHDVALDSRGASAVRLQLGLQLRSIDYTLEQRDLVQKTIRDHRDQWMEWTRTWGASLRFPEVELHYRGRLTSGVMRPLVQESFRGGGVIDVAGTSSVCCAPPTRVAMTMDDVRMTTHQLSVSLPLR